eukprot:2620022-Prymnesium_polylepis.2
MRAARSIGDCTTRKERSRDPAEMEERPPRARPEQPKSGGSTQGAPCVDNTYTMPFQPNPSAHDVK